MTIAQVLLQDFDPEMSNTRRTLERIPEDNPAWTAHPKSMPIGRLAMHCATMPTFGIYIMEESGLDMMLPTRPRTSLLFTSREDCLAQFDDLSAKCRAAIACASDEHLSAHWLFSAGQQVIIDAPRSQVFRTMCFNHMIHHVAQLGVYLRLNDIPVPALYGPSADEQWSSPA